MLSAISPSNYTQQGYQKMRAPKELFDLVHDFWLSEKHLNRIEWNTVNSYHNMWHVPPTIVTLRLPELQTKIWKLAQPLLEEWTGQELSPVSLYGIRVYHNHSILTPHVDRMPLVISAISKSSLEF